MTIDKNKSEQKGLSLIGFILRLIVIFFIFACIYLAIEQVVVAANNYNERTIQP